MCPKKVDIFSKSRLRGAQFLKLNNSGKLNQCKRVHFFGTHGSVGKNGTSVKLLEISNLDKCLNSAWSCNFYGVQDMQKLFKHSRKGDKEQRL